MHYPVRLKIFQTLSFSNLVIPKREIFQFFITLFWESCLHVVCIN
jgi:hypothetical protein